MGNDSLLTSTHNWSGHQCTTSARNKCPAAAGTNRGARGACCTAGHNHQMMPKEPIDRPRSLPRTGSRTGRTGLLSGEPRGEAQAPLEDECGVVVSLSVCPAQAPCMRCKPTRGLYVAAQHLHTCSCPHLCPHFTTPRVQTASILHRHMTPPRALPLSKLVKLL